MDILREIKLMPEAIHKFGPSKAIILEGLKQCEDQAGSVSDVYSSISRSIKEQTVRNLLNNLLKDGHIYSEDRVDDKIHTTTIFYTSDSSRRNDIPDI